MRAVILTSLLVAAVTAAPRPTLTTSPLEPIANRDLGAKPPLAKRYKCDGKTCLQSAASVGISCASTALNSGLLLVNDIPCAVEIYRKANRVSGRDQGSCQFCLDQLQVDIIQYMKNHPVAYPSPTGVYGGAYETQYAGESGFFYYDGYGDDGYGGGSAGS